MDEPNLAQRLGLLVVFFVLAFWGIWLIAILFKAMALMIDWQVPLLLAAGATGIIALIDVVTASVRKPPRE